MRFGAALFLLLAACQTGGGGSEPTPVRPSEPAILSDILVGAHYYLWFPSRFRGGNYLRAWLRPAQKPLLGEYSSSSPAVAEQHIKWASESGIDFFTLDWRPSDHAGNALIDHAVLAARNLGQIRFCIFYELGHLGFDVRTGLTVFDQGNIGRFLADMEEIASRYFGHPSYLRVAGRPVIILYITRTASGRFAEAMAGFRSRMAQRGIDPYVIGDEIYWEVAREDGSGYSMDPQLGRIALFDAITAYNLYDGSRTSYVGYGAASTFLSDARDLYELYRRAAGRRPVIPLALPGYNDRGFRLASDHDAIPREWAPGAGEGTFFARWLEGFTLPLIDARLPMLLVTSWNEWSEDTAIEPLAPGPATVFDRSLSGDTFTQGYRYQGYGALYLDILREKTSRWPTTSPPGRP